MSFVTNSTDDISGKRCSIDWVLPPQNTIQTSNPEFTTGRFADNHLFFYSFKKYFSFTFCMYIL